METLMDYRDIVVHVEGTAPGDVRLALAIALAQRFNAHLTGLHVVPEPNVPPTYKPSAMERVAEAYARTAQQSARAAHAVFHDRVAGLPLATDYRTVEGDIAERLRQTSRFVDLLVVGQTDSASPEGFDPFLLAERVVLGAAAPLLVVPNRYHADDIGRCIVVGWDGSGEAARAIRDALPFLRQARTVTVVAVNPDRQGHLPGGSSTPAMVAHLARHDIDALMVEVTSGQRHTGDILLSHATATGADLIVMGAYGHLPLKEFILGGTTPEILEHTSIPLLMSR